MQSNKMGMGTSIVCNAQRVTRTRPRRLVVKKIIDDTVAKKVKSAELLGGIVYTDCDCNRRNGLQNDCPRGDCRGGKKCLTEPWPTCKLGIYYREKWKRLDALRLRNHNPPFCVPLEFDLTRRYIKEEKKK